MIPEEYIVKKLFGSEIPKSSWIIEPKVDNTIRCTLANYVVYGFHPGGFMTAVIANDLYRAACAADHQNKENLAHIAEWVFWSMDKNSDVRQAYGSYDAVKKWCSSDNTVRLKLQQDLEKSYTWDSLKTPAVVHNDPPF